jgi:D-ribose pyranose/furanose isomerase RbsD
MYINPKSNKIVLIKDTNEQDIKSVYMANEFNEHFINIGSNLAQLIPQITLTVWTKYSLFEK